MALDLEGGKDLLTAFEIALYDFILIEKEIVARIASDWAFAAGVDLHL